MSRSDNRQRILDACLIEAGEKGCRFTIDDIQARLKMSRRTIYRYFSSKEEMLIALLEQVFRDIHTRQTEIYEDPALKTPEKLLALLTVKAPQEDLIHPENLYEYEKYYPSVYAHFQLSYEREWFYVEEVLRQGIAEGVFRPCCVELVRLMLQNSMQLLSRGNFLERNGLKYQAALHQIADIILGGIETGGL